MNLDELIRRLADLEWEDFEVKEARTELPRSTWETVSSFSNTSGGWIIFGVKKSGKDFEIIGVENPEKIEQDFTTALRSGKFNVRILPVCKNYKADNKILLGFYIPISENKPVYFNTPANTFIRSASGDQRATNEEIQALYRDQAFGTFTSKAVPNTSVADIHKASLKRYREYLERLNPTHLYNKLTEKEFLLKLSIVADDQISYGGLLSLGINESIQKQIPDFRIDYLEIPGTSYSDASSRYTFRLDEQENLLDYFFAIFGRFRRHLDLPFKLTKEGFVAEDFPYLEALREALVNLLMHSDYFSPGKPRIRVFDDRIEFFNPGALPKPLKKLMAEDISMPRNPIIAKIFRVVKLAENAGYGFDKMISGWKRYTGNAPVFEPGQDYTKVTFFYERTLPDERKGEEKVGKKWGKSVEEMGKTSKAILVEIETSPEITIAELASILKLGTTAIENNIRKLKEIGVIKRRGSRKSGFWEIVKVE